MRPCFLQHKSCDCCVTCVSPFNLRHPRDFTSHTFRRGTLNCIDRYVKLSTQYDTHDDAFRPSLDSPTARSVGSCTHSLLYSTISFSGLSAPPSEYSGPMFPFPRSLFPRTRRPLPISGCASCGWSDVKGLRNVSALYDTSFYAAYRSVAASVLY